MPPQLTVRRFRIVPHRLQRPVKFSVRPFVPHRRHELDPTPTRPAVPCVEGVLVRPEQGDDATVNRTLQGQGDTGSIPRSSDVLESGDGAWVAASHPGGLVTHRAPIRRPRGVLSLAQTGQVRPDTPPMLGHLSATGNTVHPGPRSRCRVCPKQKRGSTRAYREARQSVLALEKKCWICNQPIHPHEQASADHVTPRSAGGTDHPSNLRAAHLTCNKQRGAAP